MNSSQLLNKLNDIRSEADSLVSINEAKIKENEKKHETLKSEIEKKLMQLLNALFKQKGELNEKTDKLKTELTFSLDSLMNQQKSHLNNLQELEVKINSGDLDESINKEIEEIERKIKFLKEKLNCTDFNLYFKSNESNPKLGDVLVSLIFIID